MELEVNTPKFKTPAFKGFTNPFTKEGTWALVIVLGIIVAVSGVVYAANLGKGTESTVLPAKTEREVTVTPEQAGPEEELPASPSPTGEVLKPTVTPTPAIERIIVTPTPTI